MKRFISLLLIAVLVLACFTGCGKKDDNVSDDPNGMIEDATKPTASTRPSVQAPSTQDTELIPSESEQNSNSSENIMDGTDNGFGGSNSDAGSSDIGNGGNGMSGSGSEDDSSSTTEGTGRNRRARPLLR